MIHFNAIGAPLGHTTFTWEAGKRRPFVCACGQRCSSRTQLNAHHDLVRLLQLRRCRTR